MLDLAARHAVRAWGRVEPNPLVGCVLARRLGGASLRRIGPGAGAIRDVASLGWEVLGVGHHRRFGGAHAEAEALRNAAARGADARGSTAWVTLEPCDHTGKTGPCSRALLEAGVAEVVYARRDPNPISRGGAETLARAGALARESGASAAAIRLAQPFVAALRGRTPWVIAKWAQTPDGRLATRPGEPRWISCEASRRRVHGVRARVGAIVTGVGTVLTDDPLLTVRGGRALRGRAPAVRVVLDSSLRTPVGSAIVRSAREAPLVIVCARGALAAHAGRAAALAGAGAEVVEGAGHGDRPDFGGALAALRGRGVHQALLEAGPTLLATAFDNGLVDEAWAFVGAGAALTPAEVDRACALAAPALADTARWERALAARSGLDALAVWRRREPPGEV